MKGELASATMSSSSSSSNSGHFARDELRQLFVLVECSTCETQELLAAAAHSGNGHCMLQKLQWLDCAELAPQHMQRAMRAAMASGRVSAACLVERE